MRDLLLPSVIALIALYCATNPAEASSDDSTHRVTTSTRTRTAVVVGSPASVGTRAGAARAATPAQPVVLTGTVAAPGTGLRVRSTPSDLAPVLRTLPHDSTVGIVCHTRGTPVRGPFGVSDVWDRIAPGQYVADAFVRTGRETWRVPAC